MSLMYFYSILFIAKNKKIIVTFPTQSVSPVLQTFTSYDNISSFEAI